jgi:hypothetical protein
VGCTVPSRERWWASRHYGGIVLTFRGLIFRSHTGTQMFTEFVDECRTGRLKAKLTGTSADVSTTRQKKEPVLKEALGLTAVVA